MEMSAFEEAVERAMDRIPPEFREILEREGIQVLARERVPRALRERYRGRFLFGTFTGVPYNQRSMFDLDFEPTRIELYKSSFERACESGAEIEDEIVKTVIHEIGHYFGFSERELRRRGY